LQTPIKKRPLCTNDIKSAISGLKVLFPVVLIGEEFANRTAGILTAGSRPSLKSLIGRYVWFRSS
jgi:hypothetical protein